MVVGDALVFPGFLTPVLSLLFSNGTVEVRVKNTPGHESDTTELPGRDRPKSLKLVVASPSALRIMGIALRLARQCQDNGLVKYWFKIVKETLICELSPLNN